MAQLLITLAVVFVAVISLAVVVVTAVAVWRRSTTSGAVRISTTPALRAMPRGTRAVSSDEAATATEPELFDRVVRVMTLIFLASVGVYVFVGGEFRQNEAAIQLLLAAGMLSVVLVQDLLPARALGRARYWLEAGLAIAFVALLTGATGGLGSPFVIGFFLVVAGASLSLDEAAPLLLALLAAAAYALVGVAVEPTGQLSTPAVARLLFTVISLSLLAYLASVVGREQRRVRDAAISLSRFDALTSLYNRAHFFSVLEGEIRRSARSGRRFAIVMLDLDDLKPVNDTFGHPQGDELLRAVSGAIQANVRSTDVAARYGGDEFVVLLSDTEPDGARVVAEKLRGDIAAVAVGAADRPARTSASIGVVSYPDDGTSIEALMADVDKAMYEAKRRGKNQIVGYTTRTERVPTPLAEQRTALIERAGSTRSNGRVDPGAIRESGDPAVRREPLAPFPPLPRGDSASRGEQPHPVWDSTLPAGSAPRPPVQSPRSGNAPSVPARPSERPPTEARPAEPRAYVAFPVERAAPSARRPDPEPDRRDFTPRR